MSISKQLRDAINSSELSLRQLAKETGVAQPVLSHFLSDDPAVHRDIRLERTADKLAEFFGLILVAKPSAASPPSAKKKSAAAAAKSSTTSTAVKSSAAGTPARRKRPGSKSSSRGTVRKLTPAQMDEEIARVEWKNGKGKGRLRIVKDD